MKVFRNRNRAAVSPNGPAALRGFTLVELILVIVIIGTLAAFAVPRFVDDRTFVERGYYEELVAALKFARKLAVSTGCPVRIQVDASGYAGSQQQAVGAAAISLIRVGARPSCSAMDPRLQRARLRASPPLPT